MTTEAIDFDQMAVDTAASAGRGDITPHIKEALRQVWNARGAADIAALEAEVWTRRDADTLKQLDR